MDFKEDELQVVKLTTPDSTQPVGLRPGSPIAGKYKFVSVLGEGGMSAVYKAHDPMLDRAVAVKMLHPFLSDKELMYKRLRQEGRAISQLNHPNIVRVHEFGIIEGSDPFIVMDFVQGESLQQMIHRGGAIAPDVAVDIFKQITSALAHAHERGVLHRDLKPGNVMISRDNDGNYVVTLVDLGIAKIATVDGDAARLTATGELFGSPLYMSPEQARGMEVDVRSELYSLGCLMYECLTGKPVFEGTNSLEIIFNHINKAPDSIASHAAGRKVPLELQELVARLLEKEPNSRFQSAKDVLVALESCLGKEAIPTYSSRSRVIEEAAPVKVEPKPESRLMIVGLVGVIILIGAGIAIANGVFKPRPVAVPGQSTSSTTPGVGGAIGASATDQRLEKTLATLGKSDQLDLSGTDLTDKGMSSVGKLGGLHKLWLRGTKVSDVGLASLVGLTDLTTLDLADTKITDKSSAVISNLHHLKDLGVDNTAVSDEFVDAIPDNVVWLSLNGTKLTNKGLAALTKFEHLEGVTVDGDQLDDESVKVLSKIPKLQKLYVRGKNISDRAVENLSSLKALTELSLNDCAISDKGVESLKNLAGLKKLHLGGTNLTDASIPVLAGLTALEDLDVSNTHVTPAALLKLEPLHRLADLNASGITFTAEEFKQLQKQHKGAHISGRKLKEEE